MLLEVWKGGNRCGKIPQKSGEATSRCFPNSVSKRLILVPWCRPTSLRYCMKGPPFFTYLSLQKWDIRYMQSIKQLISECCKIRGKTGLLLLHSVKTVA